jgi:hypothetical protein
VVAAEEAAAKAAKKKSKKDKKVKEAEPVSHPFLRSLLVCCRISAVCSLFPILC